MYPALESLEAKGFITCQGDGRRKVYSLTPKGENIIDQVQKKRQEQFMEMKAYLSNFFDE
jgi:DNA-binding PadR family transcriptional regulator